MGEETAKPMLLQIVECLQRHGVEFLVLGGQAAVLHGSPIPTFDVDLCYARTAQNLERLASALKELHPTLRGAPPDLPFILDSRSLALGTNFTFSTDFGPLDLLGWVEPLGTFEDLRKRAVEMDLAGTKIWVIDLDDLIAIKRHLGRPKDQAALVQLEALRKILPDQQNP